MNCLCCKKPVTRRNRFGVFCSSGCSFQYNWQAYLATCALIGTVPMSLAAYTAIRAAEQQTWDEHVTSCARLEISPYFGLNDFN
jgi:ribosomal protein L37AE/L43A